MRRPPGWALSMCAGSVASLMPTIRELDEAQAAMARGSAGQAETADAFRVYCKVLAARWPVATPERMSAAYAPGALAHGLRRTGGVQWDGEGWKRAGLVEPGDTLVCGCGPSAPCHRILAAVVLEAAGWSVVLDGAVDLVSGVDAPESFVERAIEVQRLRATPPQPDLFGGRA